MINQSMDFRGSLKIVKNGETVLEKHNLVVTTGKAFGVSRLIGAEFAALSAIGIGSGAVAPDVSNTALGSQLALVAFDSAAVRNGAAVTMTTTFGPGVGTGTITEAGLFNGTATGSVMFSRSTFTGIPKQSTDTIAVSWTVTAP